MEAAKRSLEAGNQENLLKTPALDSADEASENARLANEVQLLLKKNEQRNAELAIISSVQQGLVSKLDFQSIIDLVGDQVHAITNAKSVSIALYDKISGTMSWPYWLTLGKRIGIPDLPTEEGITRRVMYADKPLNLGTEEEILAYDAIPPQAGWTVGKSFLGVPFSVGNAMLGALSLHDFDAEHAFNESDEHLLQTLANSMSIALENARLFDETKQRAAELAIINSAQEGLASKLEIQAIYELVGDKIREIFHNADTEIRIHDPRTNLIRFPYFTDQGKRIAMDPIPLTDVGATSYILRTGKMLVINENLLQEMEKYGWKMLPGGHPAKSAVFVPLTVNNQARGLIVLGDVEHEHAFSEADVRLLQTLANSMSTALENARLFDETQHLLNETEQRAAELVIINSVQEGLASKLDVQAIYDLVGDKIRDIFHAQGTAIYLFDHQTKILDTPYCYLKKRFEIEARPFSEHPIAALMVNKLQPITYRTVKEYRLLGGAVLENSEEYKSGMYVPLMVGKELKGMVGIANLDKENAYDDSDLRLLQTLANSMSVALENARLFDETQRLLKETEQRNAELAIINSVQAGLAEGLASKRDMQSIYNLVGDKIRELFPNTDTEIRIYDAKTNLFHVPYYLENGQRVATDPIPLSDATMSAHVLRTGQTLVINENIFQEMEKYGAKMMLGRRVPAKSAVFVPLLVGDQGRGLMILSNVEREYAFSPLDVRLFETLADSMSTALENARLFDEVQKKNAEITEALERETASNDILRVIAESPTDIQPVLEVIARNAAQLSGSDDAIITLRDGDILRVDAHYGDVPTFPVGEGMRFSRDSVAGRAILEGRPLQAIHNQHGVKSEYPEGDKVAGKYGYRMTCAVPLMREGKAIGAISIRRIKPELLIEKQIALIQSFANQAAIAVENVRLFNETTRLLKETEQRNAELAIINSVQEGLASKLDMQTIYDLVGDKIRDLFSAQSVWILTFDPITRTRQVKYSFEKGQRYYTSGLFPFNKLAEHLITTKKTLVINRDADARIAEFEMASVANTERFKSAIFVPLIADGEVKGFISLQNIEKENAFSDSDISLLSTLASSMSVALENARLFDETQRLLKETEQRAAELAIINSVQEGLSSKLDMQAIYELVGDKMQEIFDAQSLLIITFDQINEMSQVTYNREKGIRYYADPYPLTGLHRYLIQSRKTVVINENSLEWQSKFGMILLPGTEAPKSMLFVPLTSGYRVSGAISLQNLEREHAFSETDVRLLETLASSMSVALENASLFDETQRLFLEAKEARTAAEQANQAKSAFLSSMSHELRTPLNAIINFVEMIARGMIGPVNQEQVELLDQTLHSSKHLLNLINDVLDISKIQAGELTLFIEDQVSVQVEMEAALSIVGGLIQEKGLRLIRDIDPHLPTVSCDRRRLRQVLLNLISNAIKFTNEGTVTVSVKHQGREVLFAVIDTGPGIPPDKQNLIFEPFIQAENGERQMHGTGLGLPISRSLVRAHGGELWVESQPEEGSAFFFTLPVDRRSTP